jgi:hypothetical protein
MKNITLVFLLILVLCKANAADTLVTKLINTIYLERVDTTAKYYYLYKYGDTPLFDMSDLDYEPNNKLIKEIPFQDFADAIKNDTSKIDWSAYNLTKAICLDKDHLPIHCTSYKIFKQMPYNTPDSIIHKLQHDCVIAILIKPGMSKKEINAIEKKANDQYENVSIEQKKSYRFSKPIFSKKGDYVLIRLNSDDAGCVYLFKLSAGKWIRILKFGCWVS